MKIKEYLPAVIVCSIFMLITYMLHHFDAYDSMIFNSTPNYLSNAIHYHETFPPFAKRLITNSLVNTMATVVAISKGTAFIIFSLFFYFLNGLLVYYLSLMLKAKKAIATINIVFYYFSFSNLFAFFSPIYTYDEPIQFFFILISFIFLLKQKNALFSVSIFLAILARESTLILLPGLFYLFFYKPNKSWRSNIFSGKTMIYILLPIMLYFIYFFLFNAYINTAYNYHQYTVSRFNELFKNFSSYSLTIESIFSFILVMNIPLYFIILLIKQKAKRYLHYKKYVVAFFITLLINTPIVYITMQARESRLFILPLFFIFPIFGNLFYPDLRMLFSVTNIKNIFITIKTTVMFLLLNGLNYIISFHIYKTTIGNNSGYFNVYLFLCFFIIILHGLIHYRLGYQNKFEVNLH